MSHEVRVSMPLHLTPAMIKVVRDHESTSIEDKEEWYTRLGWLVCAYDILIEAARNGETQ